MDQEYNNAGRCDLCRNFVRVTEMERSLLQPRLLSLNHRHGQVIGACLRPQREPRLLIRGYIFEIHKQCTLFEKGFYKETLGISCPVCTRGQISVSRPKIQDHTVIILGCNQYPECHYSTRQLELKTLCRFCGIPLILTGGDLLKCFCPRCNRSVSIPVSLRTWPRFFKPEGGCVHFETDANCGLCNTSRSLRKSLLDLELSTLIKSGNHPNTINITKTKFDDPEDPWDEELDDELAEDDLEGADEYRKAVEEEHLDYVRDYHTLMIEEFGDGSWQENLEFQHNHEAD